MVRPPYRRAVRLCEVAVGHWESIDGLYSGQGVDILALPFSRYLSVIYVWALEHQSSEDAEKWMAELDSPFEDEILGDDGSEYEQMKNL